MNSIGFNPYLLEMANIREHCTWVHSNEKEEATQKAKDIITMSVAKARNLVPLKEIELPVNHKGLVLGGGLAGMKAALSLARQGFEVYLVEKGSGLGGNLKKLHYTLQGEEIQPFLEKLINEVKCQNNIKVFTGYEVKAFSGYVGNYKTVLDLVSPDRKGNVRCITPIELKHGIVIVATGGKPFEPTEYCYGDSNKVVTQQEFENMIVADTVTKDLRQVVMIQCVGARNKDRPYCSRICCGMAIKNALKLKALNENAEIIIFYRDIRTYGFMEDFYSKARDEGILFIRYEPEKAPKLDIMGEDLRLTFHDLVLDLEGEISPDLVVLSTPVIPEGSRELGQLLKVPVTTDGFFMEAHMKLRPLDFSTEGIFLCGMAHYPKFIPETISQATGAAARAATILSKDTVVSSGAVCEVSEDECIGCGLCEKVCPYSAIVLEETSHGKMARVISAVCKGCGVCAAKCPTGAITQNYFTDQQILAQVDAAYSVPMKKAQPKILAFLCHWCGYAGADLAGVSRIQYASNIRVIRVMCSGRIYPKFIYEAFLKGMDAVIVVGCHLEDCHYISGINQTIKTIPSAKKALEKIGINPERLQLEHCSAAEGAKYAKIVNSFAAELAELGFLELNTEQKDKLLKLKEKKEGGRKEKLELMKNPRV